MKNAAALALFALCLGSSTIARADVVYDPPTFPGSCDEINPGIECVTPECDVRWDRIVPCDERRAQSRDCELWPERCLFPDRLDPLIDELNTNNDQLSIDRWRDFGEHRTFQHQKGD